MDIKAADVKKLRDKTGAGMMDCKKALLEAAGDFAKAETILKELGLAAAAKRSAKAANEGRVFSSVGKQRAGLIEFSSETDFVARNQEFIEAGEEMVETVVESGLTEANEEIDGIVDQVRGRIKENISLKRFTTLEYGERDVVVDYIHGEGKIGVLVKIETDSVEAAKHESVKQFAFDCALHIAAFNPAFLTEDDVDEAYVADQEAIFRKQVEGMDKPDRVIEGIVGGKLKKHLAEVVLLEQGFVKEDKSTVAEVAKRVSKEADGTVDVAEYRYYRVGDEG